MAWDTYFFARKYVSPFPPNFLNEPALFDAKIIELLGEAPQDHSIVKEVVFFVTLFAMGGIFPYAFIRWLTNPEKGYEPMLPEKEIEEFVGRMRELVTVAPDFSVFSRAGA